MSEYILVIDDNAGIRKLLQEIIHTMGFACTVVASGTEALEHIKQSSPVLVLLDWRMPGISGLELIRQLKGSCVDLTVILMSAYTDRAEVDQMVVLGEVNYVIPKPFNLSLFQDVMTNAFRIKSTL